MESSVQRYRLLSNISHILRLSGLAIQDAVLRASLFYRRYKVRQELLSLPLSVREDVGLTQSKIEQFIKQMK